MFDQLKNMAALVKNASAIRDRAEQFKAELERTSVEGVSGGGAVRVTLNGKGVTLRVHLDAPLLRGLAGEEKTRVEGLIAAAYNDAHEKLQALMQQELRKATGGMNLPGMEGLLGQ